jgi:hypothetical protein
MINSCKNPFGEAQDEASDEVVDVANDFFSSFDACATIEQNAEQFRQCIKQCNVALTMNDKAHLLDLSFHNANENFWEMEDASGAFDILFEDLINDCAAAQDDFLAAVEMALE